MLHLNFSGLIKLSTKRKVTDQLVQIHLADHTRCFKIQKSVNWGFLSPGWNFSKTGLPAERRTCSGCLGSTSHSLSWRVWVRTLLGSTPFPSISWLSFSKWPRWKLRVKLRLKLAMERMCELVLNTTCYFRSFMNPVFTISKVYYSLPFPGLRYSTEKIYHYQSTIKRLKLHCNVHCKILQ